MTVRIAQFVHATYDVIDEAVLREYTEVEVVKADNFDSLTAALDGAEILHVYNLALIAEVFEARALEGRALKWIQLRMLSIDIGLKRRQMSRVYLRCYRIEIPIQLTCQKFPAAQNPILAAEDSGSVL